MRKSELMARLARVEGDPEVWATTCDAAAQAQGVFVGEHHVYIGVRDCYALGSYGESLPEVFGERRIGERRQGERRQFKRSRRYGGRREMDKVIVAYSSKDDRRKPLSDRRK